VIGAGAAGLAAGWGGGCSNAERTSTFPQIRTSQEQPFSVLRDNQEGARLPHVKRVVETPSCRIPKLAKLREHVTRSQSEWFELQIGGKSGDVVMNPDRGKKPRV
jgi:hypothetical protein